MTQTSNRLYDEFARLMTEAAGVAQGVRREAGSVLRTQMERIVADLDLVRREEFEVVRDLASNARAENERLAARIAELEAQLGDAPAKRTSPAKPKTTRAKAAPKAKPAPETTEES